jgi:glycosyltransferase involved in cell wall biosynthesis
MRSPLISVIIAAYNNGQYLPEAIHSVLTQDYPEIELIVVDDGSTDDTRAVLAAYGDQLRCHYQDNAGIASARNAGYRRSCGEFIAFLDSDDIYTAGRLKLQMAAFLEAPALECVQGYMEQFISPELPAEFASKIRGETDRVLPAPMAGTMLIKRAAYERVGHWDTNFNIGVEMDWHVRLQEAGVTCRMLEQVLLRRRIHRHNTNLRCANEQSERLHVLKKMLDRRRALRAAVKQ